MTNDNNTALTLAPPSLADRVWRWLGYRRAYDHDLIEWRTAEPQPLDWWKPGALVTVTEIRLGFVDRLRLLVSGRCEVEVSARTDAIVGRSEARAVVSVLAP